MLKNTHFAAFGDIKHPLSSSSGLYSALFFCILA